MTDTPKTYRPGERYIYEITFAEPLGKGTFPRAFLSGPSTLEEEHWIDLATTATIAPRCEGATYYLEGEIPLSVEPGLYALARVDILYSETGMNDVKKIKSIRWDQLDNFAIIVERPMPPLARDVPPVVRREA